MIKHDNQELCIFNSRTGAVSVGMITETSIDPLLEWRVEGERRDQLVLR